MGRRCRTLSRALLDAYGPLDCGLRLEGRNGLAQLEQLLRSGSAQRLRRITALELDGAATGWLEDWPAVLSLIAQALPSLTSLKLPGHPAGTDLALLAPLAPTLTSLHASPLSLELDSAAHHSLQRLTSLRSLTLCGVIGPRTVKGVWALQEALGALPHLAHLSWFIDDRGGLQWSPWLLSNLISHAPQLTSLELGHIDHADTWDQRSTAAFQRGLPFLHTLSFEIDCNEHQVVAANLEALAAGLAQCSGLRAVHLRLDVSYWEHVMLARCLSRLPLASLTAFLADIDFAEHVEPLMCALQAQSQLTKLDLMYESEVENPHMFDCRHLPGSLVDLGVAGDWDPAALMCHLQRLPCLRALELHHMSSRAQWTPAATEQLSTLTQLHTLAIHVQSPPPPHLLLALSGLTALRGLRLNVPFSVEESAPQGTLPLVCEVTNEDLHLVTLREQLTCLRLEGMHCVTAPGVAALVGELTNLRQLELCQLPGVEGDEGVGAEALLPCLACLSGLKLVNIGMTGAVHEALASAARALGCALEVRTGTGQAR